MKIAPALQRWVKDEMSRCISPEDCGIPCGQASRELRALVALAREAQHNKCPEPCGCRFCYLVNRLERISKGKP